MTTAFDVVRVAIGESSGPDLVRGIEALPLDRVDQLAEAIMALPPTESLPPRPVTEIWPLIPMRASLFFDRLNDDVAFGYSPSGVQLSSATDPRLNGSGAFSAGVVRALLYSHGLVLEDPLRHAAGMHLDQGVDTRTVSRWGLEAAVSSLSEIAELLDAGVVSLFRGGLEVKRASEIADTMRSGLDAAGSGYSREQVWDSFEAEFVAGLTAPLRDLWRRIRSGDRSPDLSLLEEAAKGSDPHLAETFVDVVAMLSPDAIIENAVESTASTVAAIAQFGGSADILCTSPLMGKLLFVGAPDPAEQLRTHEIARTSVPNIGALALSDLVKLRSASDALARWREDLATALDYANRQRIAGVNTATVQAGIGEILATARAQVSREADRTRVWTGRNLVSFVAGALGGAGGAAMGGTTAAITAGAASGAATSLIQAMAERDRVPGFLDRHYLAFASVSD